MATVFERREWRLATGGYLGHMFELYSFWTWIPAFIGASLVAEKRHGRRPNASSLIAFGTIAIGGLGCVWGGLVADRRGRERLVMVAMALSGACALLIPVAFGQIALAPGAARAGRGDSSSSPIPRNSARSSPSRFRRTRSARRSRCRRRSGFLLTMVSIQLIPPLVVGVVGWRWVFPVLALGPVAGIAAIRRLVRTRSGPHDARRSAPLNGVADDRDGSRSRLASRSSSRPPSLLAALGFDVRARRGALVSGSFGSWYAIGSGTLVRATPLILTGLAVAIAFRAGVFNIGAEGQFLVGAAAASGDRAGVAATPCRRALVIAAALWRGGLAGAAWAWIAARAATRDFTCSRSSARSC